MATGPGDQRSPVRRLFERAPDELRLALQPYGYYRPEISSELERVDEQWVATFTIRVIASVRVTELDLRFDGVSLDEEGACLFGSDAAPVLMQDPDPVPGVRQEQLAAAADSGSSKGATAAGDDDENEDGERHGARQCRPAPAGPGGTGTR